MTVDATEAEPTEETEKSWYAVWLPRFAAAILVVLIVGFGVTWVFESTTDFLLMLLVAFFLAFAMLPAVDALSRRGWRRGAATGLVMFIGLLVVLVFSAAIFSLLIGQVTQLVDRLPEYVDSVTVWLNDTVSVDIDTAQIQEELGDWDSIVENYGDDVLSGALGFTSSIVGFIFQMLTVGLFLFYILADTPKLRAALMRNLPPERQKTADQITTITIEKVGGYVYSRGLLAAASAVFHFVVFLLIGLPYPLALALWVGVVSQFVPTVGTYLAGVVPVVVALLEDPIDALWVLIAIIAYQQIENYLISPRITANTMDLHPAVAFGSAILGAQLLGGLGALLALPVAATVTALVQTYTHRYDLIDSDRMESPEQYEARMAAKKAEKDKRKGAKDTRLREILRRSSDPASDEGSTT
jgi:predicted PurR-regulated permease PerM